MYLKQQRTHKNLKLNDKNREIVVLKNLKIVQ